MQAPDPVETILARLMPPGLSESGSARIEEMLDELAGPPAAAPAPVRTPVWRWLAGSGIAAGIGALIALFPAAQQAPAPAARAAVDPDAGLVVISESDRIEAISDEGWQENPDGAAVRSIRLRVVEENQVRDEESGMIMRITEPREEVLLVPVESF